MSLGSKLGILFCTLLLGASCGYGIRGYIAAKESTALQLKQQKQVNTEKDAYLAKLADRDAKVASLQTHLSALDTTQTKALNHALDTNQSLRGDLAVSQRMRLRGTTCPARSAPGSETHTAGRMGHDTGIELSGTTRQAVFDLRASLVSDRAKLNYLQGYYRELNTDK